MTVDHVFERMAARIRRSGHGIPDPLLERLVTELFLDAVQYALDWESRADHSGKPPRAALAVGSFRAGNVDDDVTRRTRATTRRT